MIGRATNEELREALTSGEVPTKFANGNGQQHDLAVAIATAINPLIQGQLDEERVRELIDARMADVTALVEAKLAERQTVTTFEVQRPDGSRINVGRASAADGAGDRDEGGLTGCLPPRCQRLS